MSHDILALVYMNLRIDNVSCNKEIHRNMGTLAFNSKHGFKFESFSHDDLNSKILSGLKLGKIVLDSLNKPSRS